eukprot:XP_019921319.1 PREDICTED: uncharacterized protein LOC109618320 [Crassostrea gigas]
MVWRYQIYHKALGLLDFLGFDHSRSTKRSVDTENLRQGFTETAERRVERYYIELWRRNTYDYKNRLREEVLASAMDVKRGESPSMGEKIFRMVTPPAKREARRSLKSTSLGMAAKYRLSTNSSVSSNASSTSTVPAKPAPNKVNRVRKSDIDLQLQKEMEQIRMEEEERKRGEELMLKEKQKIKIEDFEDYDLDAE